MDEDWGYKDARNEALVMLPDSNEVDLELELEIYCLDNNKFKKHKIWFVLLLRRTVFKKNIRLY